MMAVAKTSCVQRQDLKRKAKNVTWAQEEKLCQVRLFVAEDAPTLTGTIFQQDLLQAKRTRSLLAADHVSEDDLPPGFEGVAVKRARVNAEAYVVMTTHIPWRCADKIIYNSSWQVVAGGESTEVSTQRQREVRVLEAVYPRTSVIPQSPVEPQEVLTSVEDDLVPSIPLTPVEDDDGVEESSMPANRVSSTPLQGFGSEVNGRVHTPVNQCSTKEKTGQSGLLSCPMPLMVSNADAIRLSDSLGKSGDPNIAAAAAAAYAVLKAKEDGTPIDHELLVKILTNPAILGTLIASNENPNNQLCNFSSILQNEISNRKFPQSNFESVPGIASVSVPGNVGCMLPVKQERLKIESPVHGSNSQVTQGTHRMWGHKISNNGLRVSEGRPLTPGSAEVFHGLLNRPPTRVVEAPARPNQSVSSHEAIMKGPFQQTFNVNSTSHSNRGNLKLGTEPDKFVAAGPVSRVQTWTGNGQTSIFHLRNDGMTDFPRGKLKKPCIYFNTPRGCRNGINCNFLHVEIPTPGQTNTDVSQPQ